jgi:hypothetical protein
VLAAFPDLDGRIVVLEAHTGTWLRPWKAGAPLPFRILPVLSDHARHLPGVHYADGEVERDWTSWEDHRLRHMKEGQPFAFLIDALDEDGSVRFRVHYQDAAARSPAGFPPAAEIAERPVDVAVLTMPSWWAAGGYPHELISHVRARHVVAIHYEDFFRASERPLRFVRTLSDRRADGFLRQIACGVDRTGSATPVRCSCGPCGPQWSMPLPGDTIVFRPRGRVDAADGILLAP